MRKSLSMQDKILEKVQNNGRMKKNHVRLKGICTFEIQK